MTFKEARDEATWGAGPLDPRLVAILLWLDHVRPIVITSLHRPGDYGPHGDMRAADVRTRDWPEGLPRKVAAAINRLWPYGDGQHPTALYHEVRPGAGWHLHLQVRPPRMAADEITEHRRIPC